jgi:acetylornithine/succinyldiaminopimelate/putrescine aminotransferase
MTLIEAEARYIQPTYTRQPITITRGSGSRVWDLEGNEYIDCIAGVAVNVCGHLYVDNNV